MNTILKHFIKISLMLVLLLQAGSVEAQTSWITWNTQTGTSTTLTGTYPGGTVTISQIGTGTAPNIYCPGLVGSLLGLVNTSGSSNYVISILNTYTSMKDIVFTFSTPVKINRMNIIGFESVSNYHDQIAFTGLAFNSFTTDGNVTATSTGASAIGTNSGYVKFVNSTSSAVNSFTLSSIPKNGLYTAATTYEIEVTALQSCATAPTLSATTITNNCTSSSSVNLNSLVATTPTGASLQWFSDNTHTNAVTTPTAVTSSGTYYAFYYDATNNCYSPVSAAVTATLTACCPTASPTVN